MVVDRDAFWYDIIGNKYASSILGTKEYIARLDYLLDEEFNSLSVFYYIGDSSLVLETVNRRIIQIMMNDVNNYGNTSGISEENWRRFCYRFNKTLPFLSSMNPDIHYFRNKLNRAPSTLEEMVKINNTLPENEKWDLLSTSLSRFHMFRTSFSLEGEKNLKFVSYDGIFEGVYNEYGFLLTEKNDVWNMGTYNYRGPSDKLGHIGQDVLPYADWAINLGNAEGTGLPPNTPEENLTNYKNNAKANKYRSDFLLKWNRKEFE